MPTAALSPDEANALTSAAQLLSAGRAEEAAARVAPLIANGLRHPDVLAAFAVGHDFWVAPALALGLELRIVHAWFPDRGRTLVFGQEGSDPLQLTYGYGSRTWFGLTFTGRVLL